MKHSVYLLLYKLRDQNPQTRQQQQTSSCSFSFFLFFSFVLSSVNSPYTMCCAHSAQRASSVFLGHPVCFVAISGPASSSSSVQYTQCFWGRNHEFFFGEPKGSCTYTLVLSFGLNRTVEVRLTSLAEPNVRSVTNIHKCHNFQNCSVYLSGLFLEIQVSPWVWQTHLWVRPCQFLRADIVVVQYTVSVYICSHNHLAFVKKVFFVVVVFLGQKTKKSPFS